MARHFGLRWLVVAVALFALGCGSASPMRKEAAPAAEGMAQRASGSAGEVMYSKHGDGGAAAEDGKKAAPEPAKKDAGGGAPPDAAVVKASPTPPMIVYTATLDVIVKDLEVAGPEVEKLVAGHNGFVAKSEVKSDSGTRRTATYTLRVPVAAFTPLKQGVLALGTPERNSVDTQDVTEEFIDVEKRIKNLMEQEAALNELLKEKRREEKLEDIIKVSDRIYLVRGDIERAQGRRNYLQNRVQLSTIYVTLREIKDYKPTATTFGTRISDTFRKSWEGLVDFGEGSVLVAVSLAPWAPIWVPALVALVWAGRRLIRQSRESAPEAERVRPRPAFGETVAEAEAEVEATERVDLGRPLEGPKPPT
jgi:hypothetical protein